MPKESISAVVDRELYLKIGQLIEKGIFRNYSEAVKFALKNLVALDLKSSIELAEQIEFQQSQLASDFSKLDDLVDTTRRGLSSVKTLHNEILNNLDSIDEFSGLIPEDIRLTEALSVEIIENYFRLYYVLILKTINPGILKVTRDQIGEVAHDRDISGSHLDWLLSNFAEGELLSISQDNGVDYIHLDKFNLVNFLLKLKDRYGIILEYEERAMSTLSALDNLLNQASDTVESLLHASGSSDETIICDNCGSIYGTRDDCPQCNSYIDQLRNGSS